MKLSERKTEYKIALKKIEDILEHVPRNNRTRIYKALLDVFPGQIPPFEQFIYNAECTPRQLLRALHSRKTTPEASDRRPPLKINEKFGVRKNPLEIRYPEHKTNNWRETYRDPTCILLNSLEDKTLCDMNDRDALNRYKTTGNMLYVLEAFFRRVDQLTGGLSEERIQSARPEESDYEVPDGGGLYLVVRADGSKEWHFEITIKVKSRKSTVKVSGWHCEMYENRWRAKQIGVYPEMSLSYARRYRDAAKILLAKRKNPFSKKNEIEEIIENLFDDEKDVPIPAWMAQVLADGFKHYYSRRILSGKQDTTLDAVFGIEGNKRFDEFNDFSIDNIALVEEARNIQWHCNLKFTPALNFALKKIRLEHSAYGDNMNGQELYRYTHAKLKTICQEESRGKYGSYGTWHTAKEHSILAPKSALDNFLGLIEAIDNYGKTTLKQEIETAMKDPKKRLVKIPTKSASRKA